MAKCKDKNCNKYASFNIKGQQPVYCLQHKSDEMINVVSKKCIIDECGKLSIFNFPNESFGIYCVQHKLNGMINVKDKTCINKNCKKQPYFNYPNQSKGIYCKDHKLEGMVNVKEKKKCLEKNCNKQPYFNYLDQNKGIYCKDHKLEGMVNVKDKKCLDKNCNLRPYFNYPDQNKGTYCLQHKKEGMINIINKVCILNLCSTQANRKYRGYCFRCFVHTFPDEPVCRNYRIKERIVTDYIKLNYSNFKITFDKMTGGCSRRRPDIVIDLMTHVIIIEIDENQHRLYDTTCEEIRINEIYEDFAYRPIVFIRFNPDGYIDKHGVNIKSCFCIDKKTGVLIIDRKKKTEWTLRLEKLRDRINYHINNIVDHTIFEYLYY